MADNLGVNDVPKHLVTPAAKRARLPIGLAAAPPAIGVGKRIGGRPAEVVTQEIQQRTAEQNITHIPEETSLTILPKVVTI